MTVAAGVAPGSVRYSTWASNSRGAPRWASARSKSTTNRSRVNENGGRAAPPGVVLGQRVGEPVALANDDVPLPAEQSAHRDRDEDDQQREVEHHVAGLAQVALLRGHPAGTVGVDPGSHAPASSAQRRPRPVQDRVTGVDDDELGRVRHPGHPPGRGRWWRAHRPDVLRQPGQDAADQRDEEQQVHRGEPRRGVHLEEPQAIQQRPARRVRGDPVLDLQRVRSPLGQYGSGDRRHRETEQQDQRRAHARQLAPGPAQQADPSQRGQGRFAGRGGGRRGVPWRRGHSGVSNPGTCTRSQIVRSVHNPVTSRRPTTISSPPPIRMTQT